MRPFSPLHFLLFIAAIVLLLAFIQIGILSIAFDKLGLSSDSAVLLLFSSLFGSAINLPLFSVSADAQVAQPPRPIRGLLLPPQREFTGRTLIAINVGGGLIPICFSLYLILHNHLAWVTVVLTVALVAAISRLVSRPIAGLGIGMPIFVAPISAALIAVIVDSAHSAPLAYVCGTLGVLIGADLLRLKDIRRMGVPIASIGGAGTFDGIFITGIVAVLLA
ncbi:MAG: DUF1614 domain-containing protein [Gammaproteobacteria bacterium]